MDISRINFLLVIIFILNTTPALCQRRRRPNPLAALLKNSRAPGNAEALQLLKLAASSPYAPLLGEQMYLPLPNGFVPTNMLPNAVLPSNMLPNAVLPSNMLPNAVLPSNMLPNMYMPNQLIVQKQVQPKLVEAVDVPKRVCAAKEATPVNVPSPVVVKERPLPAPMVNPYLPAASPVSALAPPTSSLLPPADINRSRCNFLRKIPIPPPTL